MKSFYKAMRQCYRKAGYTTEKKARNKVKKILEISGVKLYVYDCRQCGNFHLTKNKTADGKTL